MNGTPKYSRAFAFLTLCAACIGGLGWYYSRAAAKQPAVAANLATPPVQSPSLPLTHATAAIDVPAPAVTAKSAPIPARPRRLFFRWTAVDPHYGRLAYVDQPALDEPLFIDSFSCEVVHYAAGKGVCLVAERGVFTRYTAELFDENFKRTHTIPLNGIPSRTRLSPDGRLAAVTVFLTGHSYASVDFTTQTLLIDAATGNVLADLEQFAITRDGQPFASEDFNFWGVTFTPDGRRFYCTLSSKRKHYLVEGEVASRTGRVIHENVECPSLSPDTKRVAYKKRLPGDRVTWQFHVLDLATMRETPLAEHRNVDDQIEWLDNRHVLYALPESQTVSSPVTNVWTAATDGSEQPRLFLANAYSPATVQ